jgi:subtilisin family serine protease
MKRYLLRPIHPAARPAAQQAARAVLAQRATARSVQAQPVSGQQILMLDEADARSLAVARRDLIVEEDKPLELYAMPGLPPILPADTGEVREITVTDPDGAPIPDCTVFAVGQGVGFRGDTGADGTARIALSASHVDHLIVSPRRDFWSRVVAPAADGAPLKVTLSRLDPIAAMGRMHRLLGLGVFGQATGAGVRVAVVDSGIAPGPALTVAGGINTLDDGAPNGYLSDEKGHGTHVAGVIAGSPNGVSRFRGIAPGAEIFSVKVFPGGYTSDLIEAVDWCRENRMDLVNLSLGGRDWSLALDHAIRLASAAGVTLVAAAGNDGSTVAFPAAHPDVIAVAAIGLVGSFGTDSAHALKIGPYRDWWGGLFSASFSNRGPEVDVCAPGVAVASTVPDGFAAWDGTSMACPMVTGLLAQALHWNPALCTGTRTTVEALRWLVGATPADTGLPPPIQGRGLLTAPRMMSGMQVFLT